MTWLWVSTSCGLRPASQWPSARPLQKQQGLLVLEAPQTCADAACAKCRHTTWLKLDNTTKCQFPLVKSAVISLTLVVKLKVDCVVCCSDCFVRFILLFLHFVLIFFWKATGTELTEAKYETPRTINEVMSMFGCLRVHYMYRTGRNYQSISDSKTIGGT